MSSNLSKNSLHLILDNVRSAFNVGSIFRTADACNAAHLHLCGMTAAPPNPRLLRTSLGAHETVAWTHYPHTRAAFDLLDQQNIPVIAVEIAPAARNFADFPWPDPLALIFGHERRGIDPQLLPRCAATVQLPMFGQKNTLNVATAAGIVMYDVLRKWGRLNEPPSSPQQKFLYP